jgi:hypothetical protein
LAQTKEDTIRTLRKNHQHFEKACEIFALRERVFAAREGHTALRLLQLAKLIGDSRLIDEARKEERLIVVRGKQDVTPETARELLQDAGLLKTTMMLSELGAIAGKPNPGKDESVIVRYKPQTKEEARELLKSLTYVMDATKPDYPVTFHAGFSNDELLQGKTGVWIRENED